MSEDEFKSRLKIAKNKAAVQKDQKNPKSSSNMGTAFKMSTELVSAGAVGTIIGFILDNWSVSYTHLTLPTKWTV